MWYVCGANQKGGKKMANVMYMYTNYNVNVENFIKAWTIYLGSSLLCGR